MKKIIICIPEEPQARTRFLCIISKLLDFLQQYIIRVDCDKDEYTIWVIDKETATRMRKVVMNLTACTQITIVSREDYVLIP